MESSELRDKIVRNLKNDKEFSGMASADVNGNYFSAADVALPSGNDNGDIFRIAVVKHTDKTAVK